MASFDQALARMDGYIWHLARKFIGSIKHIELDDLRQEGLLKLYEIYCGAAYSGKPAEDLDSIFKQSLFNRYADLYRYDKASRKTFVELEENDQEWDFSGTLSVDGFNEVFLAYYLSDLKQHLSQDAMLLLDTLLHPTPAVYHLHRIQVMRRQHVQRQNRSAWRVPTRPTQDTVGRALGFQPWKTKRLVQELQRAWQYCQHNR